MRVTDLIKGPAISVAPDTTLRQAAHLMDEAGVGALLVVDDDRLTGIVTDRDIVVRAVAENVAPDARVDAVMTMDPVTIEATADVSEASTTLAERKFRRLPVMSAGVAVGVVSADDLLLTLVTELSDAVWPIFGEVLDPQHTASLPVPSPPA